MRYANVMVKSTGPKRPKPGDLWISPNSGHVYFYNGVHWSKR